MCSKNTEEPAVAGIQEGQVVEEEVKAVVRRQIIQCLVDHSKDFIF